MAGAESQCRFDLDADAVERDAGAVVGTVHDEAAGGDGSQSGEAFAHPIPCGDALEAQRVGGSVACCRGGQRAYYFFIRRATAISSAGRVSAARSATRCADCSSVSSRATVVGLSLERVSELIVLLGAFKALPGFHKARAPANRRGVGSNLSTA